MSAHGLSGPREGWRLAALAALGGALATGCALMSKGEALSPRYFTPAAASVAAEPGAGRAARPGGSAERPARAAGELRLGRVEGAAHLEERIAYRVSDAELAYYEERRWTEPPEALVRRALERELFERRGLSRVVSGAAPTLDVEVLGFEELRESPPRARVSLHVTLRDERLASLEKTLSVDVPLGADADGGLALARAMGEALAAATRQAADAAIAALPREEQAAAPAHE